MTINNHSKTPWILENDHGSMRILASDDRATIVAANLGHIDNKQCKADAMLMVNAPIMFKAIKEAIVLTDVVSVSYNSENVLNDRMDAIAKILRKAIENIA